MKLRKKQYGSATTDSTLTFMNHAQLLQQYWLLVTSAQGATSLISCAYIQQLPFIAYTEPRPSIYCCCCRTPRVLLLQYTMEYYSTNNMQQTYSLHKATSTFRSHVPTLASLQEAAPTDPSRYQFFCVYT